MTLDEAIKHAEEVAIDQDLCCSECAEEHRQLAEWLKDYKRLLEQPTSDDCVSRAELKKWLDMNFSFGGALRKLEMFDRIDKELPPVTPTFPKGTTNGDVIEAMFPNLKGREKAFEINVTVNKNPVGDFSVDWWNAPYKKGDENDSN